MGATLATVAQITKEIYEPRITKMFNDEIVALKRVTRSSEGVSQDAGGKYVTFGLRTRRNQGIGARNENEALPTAGQQGYAAARVGLRYLYGRIQLTGQTIELVDSNPQAFMSALDGEVEGVKDDLLKDQNRQVYGDGYGTVALCGTASAASNIFNAKWAGWAQIGMQIDIVDGTTLANTNPTIKASNRQITGINVTTNVITFDGATVATSVGDIIVRTGSVKREWTGLQAISKATGVLYNVDPAVEPTWAAVVNANGGVNRPISEALITVMMDNIRANGGTVTVALWNAGVRRAYAALLQQQRQFVNTKTFTGGFEGLAFVTDKGEIPLVTDFDCPPNKVFFLNEKSITLYREKDWSFMNRDGSMWNRVAGYDAYEATMFQYSELGCHQRNSFGLLDDVTEG